MLAKVAVICGVLAVVAGYMEVDAISGNGLVWHEGTLFAVEGYDASEAAISWFFLFLSWGTGAVLLLVSITTAIVQACRERRGRGFFIPFAILAPVMTVAITAIAWPLRLMVGDATPIPLDRF